jgi:hypothetical protein
MAFKPFEKKSPAGKESKPGEKKMPPWLAGKGAKKPAGKGKKC